MEKHSSEKSEKPNKNNDTFIGKIFWGSLLVMIGGLLLLSNFGLVEVNWANLFRLWPIFIISAGMSVLSINNFVWRLILFVLAIVVLIVVGWALLVGAPDGNSTNNYHEVVAVESNLVKKYEVGIQAGAGRVNIDTSIQKDLAVATLESDVMKLEKSSEIKADKQIVNFATEAKIKSWWPNSTKNNLSIDVSRDLPLTLKVQVGAADVDIDMTQAFLESLDIKVGASSLNVKIGDKQSYSDIYIESGASNIVLKIPKDSGVKLRLESGLSAKSVGNLTKIEPGMYESTDYINAKNKINVVAKIGVASFNIERY